MRMLINKYEAPQDVRQNIALIAALDDKQLPTAAPAIGVAREYKKLEAHHVEETQFLIRLVSKYESRIVLMHLIYSFIVIAAIALARVV